jgi:CheY-like chemotaxis protein
MKPKRTILCVDDNEQSLSIRKVLLETRGYRVVTCTNGEEAIERFRKGGIDLVLTDLIMPGVDGSRVVAEVKALSPDTPAILLQEKFGSTTAILTQMCFFLKVCMRLRSCLSGSGFSSFASAGPKRAHQRELRPPTQTNVA